jgi:hypothetical protein
MYSFDYRLKQQNVEWRAQKSAETKIAWRIQVVMLFMFFSRNGLMLDHPMPVVTTVNGQYYCALLHDKVRLAVCCKPKLLEHGVVLLQDSATLRRHRDVQNLVQFRGWEVLVHPPYFPYLAPCDYWLFSHVE